MNEKKEDKLPVTNNGILQIPEEDMERSIARADKYFKFLDQIKKRAITLTNWKDWIDQSGTPYLQRSGCNKIATGFGMHVHGVEQEKFDYSDDKGEYIEFVADGYFTWNNNTRYETGTASTRDKFFAKRKIEGKEITLPLSEISIPNVRKKSVTNLMNRGIKNCLGLDYTWEEVEKYSDGKITKEKCTVFKYDSGKKGGKKSDPATTEKRSKLREMILELCGGVEEDAKNFLFSMTNSDKYKGKKRVEDLTDNQVNKFVYPAVEKQFNTLLDKKAAKESGDK